MDAYPLIVTNTDDTHADALVAELAKRGCSHFRFNTNVVGHEAVLSWSVTQCDIIESGRHLDVSKATSVVWRRPEEPKSHDLKELAPETAASVTEEALLTIQGILRAALHESTLWISHPDSIRRANFKPRQLRDATALGFNVPDTLITNDPAKAKEFIQTQQYRVAAKQAARGRKMPRFEAAVYSINLSRYPRSYIDSLLDSVRYCPVMLQQYVEKAYEVRTTFFGDTAMSAKILSQEKEAAQDDWRRFYTEGGAGLRHEPTQLPESLLTKCRAMLARYGLNFGCFDFIVTPSNEIVFLELNPNGQFLWLEYELPDFPLLAAWADLVMGAGVPTKM